MSRAEYRWVVVCALVVMAVTCLPYLYVASLAPPGTAFLGLLYAADDHCVYLSWEQQGALGQFRMRNLFTAESQRGIYLHLLSWFLGSIARLTGLPLIFVHHGARVLFGALVLALAYRLFAFFTADVATRRAAFWFTAFSAGFGWMFIRPTITGRDIVDLWQPEAITFLCLYVNGLFCVALSLMLGILVLLLGGEGKVGGARWGRVVGAGGLGLLLGNIHSYDTITLGGVWAAYLAVRATVERRLPGSILVDTVVAGLVALPATAYQYYLYRTEPVFQMRADDPFLSPPLSSYLLGYGLVLLLAVGGAIALVRTVGRAGEPFGQRLLPLTWAVVGFAIPYLPFAFQRKLLMGLHLPLAFLAAAAAVGLGRWVSGVGRKRSSTRAGAAAAPPRRGRRPPLNVPRPWAPAAVVATLLLLTVPTNVYFIWRDIVIATEESHDLNALPAFLPRADLDAIQWAHRHLPKDAVIFCSAASGRLFPAFAGRPVYVGHWSETPQSHERMMETVAFYRATEATSEERRAFLETRGVRYVYQGTIERAIGPADLARDPAFRPVYSNGAATLYELAPPRRVTAR